MILLLSIYPKKIKTLIGKDTCIPMFIVALLATAKIWKQPMCLSTHKWIKKMWYTHAMKYHSAIKKNETLPFATTLIDLEDIMFSEISQGKITIVCCHLYIESKK